MSAELRFSTAETPPRHRALRWNAVIAESYFPLELTFRDAQNFNGGLSRTGLGEVSLSRLKSDPVRYERRRDHISGASEEEFLVTLPRATPVEFRQMGKEVRCEPGALIVERGDEPYRFSYVRPNDLYVLKVGRRALSERVRLPDRYCARVLDATNGAGGLFAALVHQVQQQVASGPLPPQLGGLVGRQLLELLTLALEDAGDPAESSLSAVRAAHLTRVERFIRCNLTDPDLTPERIADGCGISKRYLHDLFRDLNATVSQRVRQMRLVATRDALAAAPQVAIAELAYRYGFTDQAQFSRLFKAQFGITPSEFQRDPGAHSGACG